MKMLNTKGIGVIVGKRERERERERERARERERVSELTKILSIAKLENKK